MVRNQRLQWWVLASAGLMLLGAFGPWVKALGESVGGTDGANDGWLVVAAAAIGTGLFYATRTGSGAGIWACLGGIGGLGVTMYDRIHIQHVIDSGGTFAQALASVGWGLNLALAASASLTLAGLVCVVQGPVAEVALLPAPVAATPTAAQPGAPPSTAPSWEEDK